MANPVADPPPSLKPISPYVKVGREHDARDPVVAYYCYIYVLQRSLEIDKTSKEALKFIMDTMSYLETVKKQDIEGIREQIVGQSHLENYTLTLFAKADSMDRAGQFSKNLIKLWYTAGLLFDVLGQFESVDDGLDKKRRYAKWKATYIHTCLKNGETPMPGPEGADAEEGFSDFDFPAVPSTSQQPSGNYGYTPPQPPQPAARQPPPQQYQPPPQQPSGSGGALTPAHFQAAGKHCKFANSAIQYEDKDTAVQYLQQALNVLQTGVID